MSKEIFANMLFREIDSDKLYRVLWLSDNHNNAYIFNITDMEMPELMLCSNLQTGIDNGAFVVELIDPYIVSVIESDLSFKEKESRDNIWAFMESIVQNEPDIYVKKERGQIIARAVETTGKKRFSLYRYLKTYWQCGKIKNAYLPKYNRCGAPGKQRRAGDTKRGRPSKYGSTNINVNDTTRTIFEKAVKKYYHTCDEHTFKYAYDMMIAEHYAKYVTGADDKLTAVLPPIEQIPTMRQFRYWYGKTYDDREKLIKRKGESKFELNHRAILGKSDYGVMGPGAKYQIDATVGDVYLVSRFNRADIIGRPVIYFIVDVFSRMITGMYVGLEGPSWAGSMMALSNAMSDKVKYCAEYGITITEDEWPCKGAPSAYLADRGEMEGKSVETLINTLNIRVENALPYRGDMKGIVERYFNTTNETALVRLPGHVKADMTERGGHDYRLDAILDIYQLTKILIECVLRHNNHYILKTYERTANMITDGVVPIPLEIWNWGLTHCSGALRTFPEDKIKLALMPADTATVTAKGIKYKNIYYLCKRAAKEYWFEKARSKGSWKVDVSFDPRNMSVIYIRGTDGLVETCWLSNWQEKYIGKTLDEILYLHESEKLTKHENNWKEMTSKVELTTAIDSIIAEAEEMARQTVVPESKSERTKNIRSNRQTEKIANRHDEAFVLGTSEPEISKPRKTPDKYEEPITPVLAMIKQQLEERLSES